MNPSDDATRHTEDKGAVISVIQWYQDLRTREIDLVGDYAGAELFLVEGDSLLLQCFSDDRIDFQDGFQMLHAVYVVEMFLENLIKRNCNFHIVFFDENARACIPARCPQAIQARYLLARSVIIRHLTVHMPRSHPEIEIHKFKSYRDVAFGLYLETAGMYFVMCHDGASIEPHIKKKIMLRTMICWFIHRGLDVALVNEVEWRDSKIFTRIVEQSTYYTNLRIWDRLILNAISTAPSGNGEVEDSDMDTEDGSQEDSKEDSQENFDEESSEEDSEDELDKVPEESHDKSHDRTSIRYKVSLMATRGILSERDILTISSLAAMIKSNSVDTKLASAVLFHTALLKHMSVSQRRIETVRFKTKASSLRFVRFITEFSDRIRAILDDPSWKLITEEHKVECDVMDMLDGRLLKMVLHIINHDLMKDGESFGKISTDYSVLLEVVQTFSSPKLQKSRHREFETLAFENPAAEFAENDEKLSLLPFSNPAFDKHLSSIHIHVDVLESTTARPFAAKISREISHWHNAKRPLDPRKALAAKQPVSKWRNPLRKNQQYMAEMTAYAASLTNTKGKMMDPEIITVGTTHATVGTPKELKENKKEAKNPKLSKAQQIIADNTAKKESTEIPKIFAAWGALKKDFDGISNPDQRFIKARAYLDNLDSAKLSVLQADVELYCLQALLISWAAYCKVGRKQEGYKVAALIWDSIRRITSSKNGLTQASAVHIDKICTLLGLTKPTSTHQKGNRPLSFDFVYPILKAESLSIGMPSQEFQLLHCGPFMDRNTDARPDARVKSFEPDGWQRKVLDELDARRSVFVVAPTSAGKTFISFYAMEKILRGDDTSVLVYVAPTKALVNQIAAEVQARFSKKYQHAGHSVWAIHTRDYRVNNSTGCQILVTVPHILQIMLLSPSNANSWARRVKCIIFDEIHVIGQAEDGIVYEQLLLMSACQIIALSATVGNPEQFSNWLKSTQEPAGFSLNMIQHQQRYSDLRKFVYTPPKEFAFSNLSEITSAGVQLGLDGATGFTYFHPIASLVNRSRGMPDDLSLEARDCFFLWRSMTKHQTKAFPVPASLDPQNALPSFIKKADIFKWEKALKAILLEWIPNGASPFDKVMAEVGNDLYNIPRSENQLQGGSSESGTGVTTPAKLRSIDPDDLAATTLPLLVELQKRNALPAILFNYARVECERIAKSVLEQLQMAEGRWKETSLEWKKIMDGWEEWKKLRESKKAQKAPKVMKKKGKGDEEETGSRLDNARDAGNAEAGFYDNFDPDEPRQTFSFADKRKHQASELKEDFRQLQWKGIAPWLMEALSRGIGVHHAGMNRKYRQIVEMLFRKGFLRVVIATGTLSLGINMPCATVVFSGDSVFLTALNFRQAAGRAGRRGFDLLGNVVFQGVTLAKACRLLSSRLPDLNGHFPITTTLVLRLFTLLHNSKNSPHARQVVDSLLSQPRLYLGGDSFKAQVLHHLRFSIEYLRKQGFLNSEGAPVNFANLVSHLYFTENSSFAFHCLLRDGYFHTLCANLPKKRSEVTRTLMIIMAHLFGRRACRSVQREYVEQIIKKSPSVVFLPPLPEKAAALLRNHNKETLSTFSTYVKTFAEQHIKEEERKLPLTGVTVGGKPSKSPPPALRSLPPPKARSAFVALSGHGDEFSSISDLCKTARTGIFLEEAVIPHLDVYPDESDAPLNAYLYDFYMHGALDLLETANGIRKSDVWFMLNDFSLVLATIVTSLANFMHLNTDQDSDMTTVVGSGDAAEIISDEIVAEKLSSKDVSAPQQSQVLPVRKRNKVLDDWDDEVEPVEDTAPQGLTGQLGSALPFEAWGDDEFGLINVYKAFAGLKQEFDEKFKAIFA